MRRARFLATLASLALLGGVPRRLRAAVFTPQGHGAVGDGLTLDTAAIQAAIDQAHAAGGGRVVLAPGRYLTGSLTLRSRVTLHLERGATLLGSPRIADYRRGAKWPALLIAVDAEAIGVTGEGVIDGQGKLVAADSVRIFESGNLVEFFPGVAPGQTLNLGGDVTTGRVIDPHALQREGRLAAIVAPRSRDDLATWRVDESVRPQLVEFSHCRGVEVSGVTLLNAANWVQAYRRCEDLVIKGIRVDSTTYWNNDGLDIVNCRRVLVADCDINAADDGICLKSEPNAEGQGCEDMVIERCRLRTSASAVKFGTASHHAFRRITIRDIDVRDTYRSAVALETVDGAVLEDIDVRRIRGRNVGNAFFLRLGHRNAAKPPGVLRNVLLADFDVQVSATKPDAGYPHEGPPPRVVANLHPSSIMGLPGHPVENVVLRNLRISQGGTAERSRAEVPLADLARIPENRAGYPEFNMFGELPAWALFVRDAVKVRLETSDFTLTAPDFRSAIVTQRVDGLSLDQVTLGAGGGEPIIALVETTGTDLRAVTGPAGVQELVRRQAAGAAG